MGGKRRTRERAVLAAIHRPPDGVDPATALAELADLTRSVGGHVVAEVKYRVGPGRAFLGKGQREALKETVEREKAQVLVVSEPLSRRHLTLLEKDLECKVLDRTRLILDLFALNARTSEAKCQVEKAQLEYTLPRLTRRWTHLSRQAGGIGVRGPGETQIEVDRRQIRHRIHLLAKRLEAIEGAREQQRKQRGEAIRVAMVGYTNAGKSTLLNALTGAGVGVEDRLFSTLDPTTRSIRVLNQPVVITDTVGFIRDLPHGLVASFRATLAEAAEADLVWEVVDAAAEGVEGRVKTSESILGDLGALDRPRWRIANKSDLCADAHTAADAIQALDDSVPVYAVSAATGEGLDHLKEGLERFVRGRLVAVEVDCPHAEAALYADAARLGVVEEEEADEEGIHARLLVPPAQARRLKAAGVSR